MHKKPKQLTHSFDGEDITFEITPEFLLSLLSKYLNQSEMSHTADLLRLPYLETTISNSLKVLSNLTPREKAIAAAGAELMYLLVDVPRTREKVKKLFQAREQGRRSRWDPVADDIKYWVCQFIDTEITRDEALEALNNVDTVRAISVFSEGTFKHYIRKEKDRRAEAVKLAGDRTDISSG